MGRSGDERGEGEEEREGGEGKGGGACQQTVRFQGNLQFQIFSLPSISAQMSPLRASDSPSLPPAPSPGRELTRLSICF